MRLRESVILSDTVVRKGTGKGRMDRGMIFVYFV